MSFLINPFWGAVGDTHFANVVLLLGMEGADASTTFTDESPAARGNATVNGNAQVDTAQFKFGAASLLCDGAGDTITFPSSVDFRLSNANSDLFAVECFVRSTTTTPTSKYILWRSDGLPNIAWWFGVNGSTELEFAATTDGANFWSANPASSGLTWAANTWYHVAANKDAAGKVRVFRDGVMVASGTPANSAMPNPSVVMSIGGDPNTSARCWPGWIDEVRITKGSDRGWGDGGFTVPIAAFPRS